MLQEQATTDLNFSSQIRNQFKKKFEEIWDVERMTNSKLEFYNTIKESFGVEVYLETGMDLMDQKRLAQFRMSTHKYNIETGRYGHMKDSPISRICKFCSSDDIDTMSMLNECAFFEPIIEYKKHVLMECPLYQEYRTKLSNRTNNMIDTSEGLRKITQDKILARHLGKFLKRCHSLKLLKTKEEKESADEEKAKIKRRKKMPKKNKKEKK